MSDRRRGPVHRLSEIFIDKVDDELVGRTDIASRVLWRAVFPIARADSHDGWVGSKHVEKLKGAALTTPSGLTVVTQAIGLGTISETSVA